MAQSPAFSIRMSSELKDRLAAEAARNGRSMAAEIEARVERTFRQDDQVGGAELSALMQLALASARFVEAKRVAAIGPEANLFTDEITNRLAKAAVMETVRTKFPHAKDRTATELRAMLQEAREKRATMGEDPEPKRFMPGGLGPLSWDKPATPETRHLNMLEAIEAGETVDRRLAEIVSYDALIYFYEDFFDQIMMRADDIGRKVPRSIQADPKDTAGMGDLLPLLAFPTAESVRFATMTEQELLIEALEEHASGVKRDNV